jgi:type I restriction enzyme M protein
MRPSWKIPCGRSPSQFVEMNDRATHRPVAAILADLDRAREERERADAELRDVLGKLGLEAKT